MKNEAWGMRGTDEVWRVRGEGVKDESYGVRGVGKCPRGDYW